MAVDKTQKHEPHTQMHNCSGLKGLSIPMIEVKSPRDDPSPTRHRHVVKPYEGFMGSGAAEQYRPTTAAIVTERFDGSNDVTVTVGTAVIDMTESE